MTMRPAACHVVPLVREDFSSRITDWPSDARWKAVEQPMMPPPMITASHKVAGVSLWADWELRWRAEKATQMRVLRGAAVSLDPLSRRDVDRSIVSEARAFLLRLAMS